MDNLNHTDVDFNEFFTFPEEDLAVGNQITPNSNFELDNSSAFGFTSQPSPDYGFGGFDGQYRLQDLPPFNPYVSSSMEASQLLSSGEDHPDASSQPNQGLYSNDNHQTDFLSHYGINEQTHPFGSPFGSFALEPSLTDTGNLDTLEQSPTHQAFVPTSDQNSLPGSQVMPTLQDFRPGRYGSTPASNRPILQGLLLANPSQRMGELRGKKQCSSEFPSPARQRPVMSLHCDWPSCKGIRFSTRESFFEHQEEHFATLVNTAKGRETYHCDWHSCGFRTPKTFKNLAALKKHLKQHVRTNWCSHAYCSLTFARKSDLERHIRTKHSAELNYPCPVDTCSRNINGFTRKDKLDEHCRKEHRNFRCTFDHCGAQVLESEMDEHLDHFHSGRVCEKEKNEWRRSPGIYECALTGCESTTSKFNKALAHSHARTHHNMHDGASFEVVKWAKQVASRGNAYVVQVLPQYRCHPCKTCIKNNSTQLE